MIIKYIPNFFKLNLTGFNNLMDHKEAISILNIKNNVRPYERYKHLIKINHPDRGGSSYLCSKINEAYEYLRKRNLI